MATIVIVGEMIAAIVSIIAGLIILAFPKIINYALGFYLIIIGALYFLALIF